MTANLIATTVTLEEAEESNLPGASQGTPSHSSPPNATANLTSTATTLVPSGTNTTAQPTSWSSTLKFLGFLILMAINDLPALDDYWKRDPLMHYAQVADRISRERFRDLSHYLRGQ